MAWTTPRTWVAGETVTAAIMNVHIRDNLKAISDPWTSFVPTLTASTSNPTLGAGTATGGYISIGKLTVYQFTLTFGAGMTAGSGNYRISLPVSCLTNRWPGMVRIISAASATGYALALTANASYIEMYYPATYLGTQTQLTAAAPWAWASGAGLTGTLMYEAA